MSSEPGKLRQDMLGDPPSPTSRRGYELLTDLFLSACERIGPEGREAVSRAGRQLGRACVDGSHTVTVEDALIKLAELGVACRIDGGCIFARLPAFDGTRRATPEIVSQLLTGLIQGVLDGTGLGFTVRPDGPVESWTLVLTPVTADSDGQAPQSR